MAECIAEYRSKREREAMMISSENLPKMRKITKEAILKERDKTNAEGVKVSGRDHFHTKPGIQKKKSGGFTFSVSVEFAKIMFEARFVNLPLRRSSKYKNYYSFVDEQQIPQIREWEKEQGRRVFLRDRLSLSIALDFNFVKLMEYTEIGALEKRGKNNQDPVAIKQLAEIVVKEINALLFYKDADLVCAVPSQAEFDLPRSVASLVSKKIGKQDVTGGFDFRGQKVAIKDLHVEDKWEGWKNAKISFNSSKFDVTGKTIILIDDKYQSGITIQYIAMKLQKAGASQIYGLSLVKTLSNKDNKR